MNKAVHNKLVSFIWSIADDCLRDVILPMHYLRHLAFILSTLITTVNQAQNFEAFNYGETIGSNYAIFHSAIVPGNGLIAVGHSNIPQTGGNHTFAIRYDDLGNVLWAKTYGPGKANCIATCPDGDFVLSGFIPDPYYRKDTFFVSRISSDGTRKWKTILGIGSINYFNQACYIAIRPDGNYAVLSQLTDSSPISLTLLDASSGAVLHEHEINHGNRLVSNGFLIAQNGDYIVYYWSQDERGSVQRLRPDFTMRWKQSLFLEYDYYSGGAELKMIERKNGELVVGGGYGQEGNLLFLNPDGTLLRGKNLYFGHVFAPPSISDFFEDLQGDLHILYHNQTHTMYIMDGSNEHTVYYFRLGEQGNQLENRTASFGIELQGELLLDGMRRAYWYCTSTRSVHTRRFDPADFTLGWSPAWVYKSDLPPTDERGLSHSRDREGIHWVLTNLQDNAPDPDQYVVYKINDDGKTLLSKALPSVHSKQHGSIMADFSDGSCLIASPDGYCWKLDREANTVWEDSLGGRSAITCKDDGFVLLSQGYGWGNWGWLRRFDSKGTFIREIKLGTDSTPVSVKHMLRRPDGIIVLYGIILESGLAQDWLAYLDSDAQIISEQALPLYKSPGNQSDALISKNDNSLITALERSFLVDSTYWEREVVVRKINNAAVQWDYTLRSSAIMFNTRLHEAPCGGYVLSGEIYSDLYRETHDYFLHEISEEGEGGEYCFFKKKPFFETPNDTFSPGFVYREWGTQINGQTSDVYYHKLSFPATAPSAALSNGSMNLFPNPSDGDICIEFNTEWRGTFDVEIMDSKGTLVAAFKREKRDAHWISHYSNETLARGIYVVRVRAENGSCLSKRWARL